ncbi:MAG: YgaP-like transmembrane domain [Syntrophomonadaceae bacterium]
MLTRNGIIARFILAFCFFFLSGTEILTGGLATLSGVLGTVELATALLRYSPLQEIIAIVTEKSENNATKISYHPALKQR